MNDMDVMYWLKMKQEGRDGETKFRVFFLLWTRSFWGEKRKGVRRRACGGLVEQKKVKK